MAGFTIDIGGYMEASAGIRALHILRDELVARGHEASMSYERVIPNSIVVYPEIQGGNPLGAEKVARWLLGAAPSLPDDGPKFQWGGGMGDWPTLCVDILEPHIWTPRTGPRNGTGYWVGRGESNFDKYESLGSEHWTRLGNSRTTIGGRADLADWLGSLQMFVTFDPYTAMIAEATNVGTPVLVLADPDDPRYAHGRNNSFNRVGVAWGMDDDQLEWAYRSVGDAHCHYREVCVPEFTAQIDAFVETCVGGL